MGCGVAVEPLGAGSSRAPELDEPVRHTLFAAMHVLPQGMPFRQFR
jgi:hypothetical protein